MFTTETLTELKRRKQALIAKSDHHRAMFTLQGAQLHQYAVYIDIGVSLVKRILPLWMIVSPLLSLWAARRSKQAASWIPSAFQGWKAIQKGMAVWRSFQ